MSSSKPNYFYPRISEENIVYKGKRFWVFKISVEAPYQGYEAYFEVIIYDRKTGVEIAGAKKTADSYIGSLIGPQDSVRVSGNSPIELLESVINAIRMYERHFSGFISPSTPRFRKRVAKS